MCRGNRNILIVIFHGTSKDTVVHDNSPTAIDFSLYQKDYHCQCNVTPTIYSGCSHVLVVADNIVLNQFAEFFVQFWRDKHGFF